MKALTVEPCRAGSIRLDDLPRPVPRPGDVLVTTVAVGICGTDREIVAGEHGAAPAGRRRLVVGHEALGRVAAPCGTLDGGDLVVPMVRHPDPVPCPACAAGEVDRCTNGRYEEHGIKALDGFAAESWAVRPDRLVGVPPTIGANGVLVEPASVVSKAWERIDRLDDSPHDGPRRVLVTGAGPIGLLAALMATQRGHRVHVLDRVTEGPKPQLVADLGATFHDHLDTESAGADITVECTGAASVVLEVIESSARNGIVCLTGLSTGTRALPVDAAAVNRRIVLENDVVFGSVSANRRHYLRAIDALAAADQGWLGRLVTRRVPLDRWSEAITSRPDDVKVVLTLS